MSECRDKIDSILGRITRFLNSTVEGCLSVREQEEIILMEKELEFYLSKFSLFLPEPPKEPAEYD